MAYATAADVTSFLGVTLSSPEQTVITDLIAAGQAFIEKKTNRTFETSGNITEFFDGGIDTFFPSKLPIASVVSVTIDNVSYDLSNVANYGNYLKLKNLPAAGYQNVQIVYTSGIAVPSDLKHALVRWVSEVFKSRQEGGKTISRLSLGPYAVDYLTQDGIPKFLEEIIKIYRLHPGV